MLYPLLQAAQYAGLAVLAILVLTWPTIVVVGLLWRLNRILIRHAVWTVGAIVDKPERRLLYRRKERLLRDLREVDRMLHHVSSEFAPPSGAHNLN